MTRSKLLAGATALALVVAAPSASFAFDHGGGRGGGGMHGGGGGMAGARSAAPPSGGAFARGSMAATRPAVAPTGGTFARGGTTAPTGGTFARGGAPGTRFAAAPAGGTFAGGRTAWNGRWRGHDFDRDRFHHRRGFFPGAVGAFAFYGGPDYYDYGSDYYAPDDYYDTGPEVAVVPGGGGDASYCAQRYRSWDPATGTYLGYDGRRHPCP